MLIIPNMACEFDETSRKREAALLHFEVQSTFREHAEVVGMSGLDCDQDQQTLFVLAGSLRTDPIRMPNEGVNIWHNPLTDTTAINYFDDEPTHAGFVGVLQHRSSALQIGVRKVDTATGEQLQAVRESVKDIVWDAERSQELARDPELKKKWFDSIVERYGEQL